MTREEFINACRKWIAIKESARELDRQVNGMFCIGDEPYEIHISGYGAHFNKIINILQPTVHYNPNWTEDYGEMYFYITIDDRPIKVFGLWKKEEEVH